jgi:hypothetical protein
MNTSRLIYWIKEREAIRVRRTTGETAPWTTDPILREWSFCNVRREDDRVTRWIAANWREPNCNHPDLFFAMIVARLINWPDTLAELGLPLPWDPQRFLKTILARKDRGELCYGPAYKIGTGGIQAQKSTYQAELVFTPLWARRKALRPVAGMSLLEWHARLMQTNGLASFMAAQVVADMKYVAPLATARDWMTFAASGPGSRRGLNRVLERSVDAPWREDDWRSALRKLHIAITPELEAAGVRNLHAQDFQNCLCEFDKMERVTLGEGKPKRKFLAGERQ